MLFLNAGVAGDCETFDVAVGDWIEVNCKCIMHSDLLSHLFGSKWHLACPARIREHCRSGWEERKIGMAQLSQSGTHSIYGHLCQTHISLALPTVSQPWMAEVCMENSSYCCSTSCRYIFREWKSSPSVVHLFLSSPGFRVQLQTHGFRVWKRNHFFLYFLNSSLL